MRPVQQTRSNVNGTKSPADVPATSAENGDFDQEDATIAK
jgi:hypothetical protein